MRRATVVMIGLLLALPAAGQAKGGVEFDKYPDTASVGEKIGFTVMAMREPTRPMQDLKPMVGRRALVTFRSKSGRVLRIRSSKTDLNGIGYGSVAFPDKGPWTTEMHIGETHLLDDMSQPINVGIGLTQTTPKTKAPPAGSPGSDPAPASATHESDASGPWIWVLSIAAIGSAAVVFAMRRRGRWGAA